MDTATRTAPQIRDLGLSVGDTIVWPAPGFSTAAAGRLWVEVVEVYPSGSVLVRAANPKLPVLTALLEEPAIRVHPAGHGPQVYAEWATDGEAEYATFETAEQLTEFIVKTLLADKHVATVHTGDVHHAAARRRQRIKALRARQKAEREEAARIANTPVVGGGATEHLWNDKLGHVVVAVSETGYKVTLAQLRGPDTAYGDYEPAGVCNGYPVWDHTYTEEELKTLRYDDDRTITAYRRKDGRYYSARCRVTFGGAHFYRNHAD